MKFKKHNQIVTEPVLNIVVVTSTSNVLTIKPVFLEKLKRLGVYEKWLTNVELQFDHYGYRFNDCSIQSFYDLVSRPFDSSKTVEGCVFWERKAHEDMDYKGMNLFYDLNISSNYPFHSL